MGLAALSALISTFALLIMKHSADVEKGLPLRPSCKHPWRKRWWIGFIMNTGSELGISTFALMFVPMTVIAPVNGSAVIFSALVARLGWVSDRIYRITQARSCSDASLLSAATASSPPPAPSPPSSSPPAARVETLRDTSETLPIGTRHPPDAIPPTRPLHRTEIAPARVRRCGSTSPISSGWRSSPLSGRRVGASPDPSRSPPPLGAAHRCHRHCPLRGVWPVI